MATIRKAGAGAHSTHCWRPPSIPGDGLIGDRAGYRSGRISATGENHGFQRIIRPGVERSALPFLDSNIM
jgi:hypothetical protein